MLCLCACGSQDEEYKELIVGSWKTENDSDVLSFYYSGICGNDETRFDKGEGAHWKIEGGKLILYNDFYKDEATIETLNEEDLIITWDGRTEHYRRLSFQPGAGR